MSTILILIMFVGGARSFVAYNCDLSESNSSYISLLNVDQCNLNFEVIDESEVNIQVLQKIKTREIDTFSCKIDVNYFVYYCGIGSKNYLVKDGIVSKLYDISKIPRIQSCLEASYQACC